MLPTAKRWAYFCKNIATELRGVSRYCSEVLGSGVDLILPIRERPSVGKFLPGLV